MECSICLADVGHAPCETVCRHVFHKECLDEWYKVGNKTCPLCRKEQQSKLKQLYEKLQKNKGSNIRQVMNSMGTNWNEILKVGM